MAMCVTLLNFDHLRITLQSSNLIWGIKFHAPSPSTHLLLPSSSYPWPPMVVSLFLNHLLIEVASPPSPPSPFRCHLSFKKQRNPLMKKILGLLAPMELTSHVEPLGLGYSSSMESFASWRLMATEWRRRKDDWRCHFKEKMSQKQAHQPWIRAWT